MTKVNVVLSGSCVRLVFFFKVLSEPGRCYLPLFGSMKKGPRSAVGNESGRKISERSKEVELTCIVFQFRSSLEFNCLVNILAPVEGRDGLLRCRDEVLVQLRVLLLKVLLRAA